MYTMRPARGVRPCPNPHHCRPSQRRSYFMLAPPPPPTTKSETRITTEGVWLLPLWLFPNASLPPAHSPRDGPGPQPSNVQYETAGQGSWQCTGTGGNAWAVRLCAKTMPAQRGDTGSAAACALRPPRSGPQSPLRVPPHGLRPVCVSLGSWASVRGKATPAVFGLLLSP